MARAPSRHHKAHALIVGLRHAGPPRDYPLQACRLVKAPGAEQLATHRSLIQDLCMCHGQAAPWWTGSSAATDRRVVVVVAGAPQADSARGNSQDVLRQSPSQTPFLPTPPKTQSGAHSKKLRVVRSHERPRSPLSGL